MQEGKTVKFVTFNIRLDWQRDGENNFVFRQPLILRTLDREQPDLICFQEVLPHVAAWLKENLKDYTVVGCGREKGLRGEQVSVAFRTERFSLMHMDTFWLSPTPFTVGSRYEVQSDCPRTCAELLLQLTGTDQVIRVVNTHLDHEGRPARELGLRQILRHIEEAPLFPSAPVIFSGDFNCHPDSEELRVFDEFPEYTSVARDIGVTYHGYGRFQDPGKPIDFIYLRGGLACRRVQRWQDCEKGVWLSDHYPVCAVLELVS